MYNWTNAVSAASASSSLVGSFAICKVCVFELYSPTTILSLCTSLNINPATSVTIFGLVNSSITFPNAPEYLAYPFNPFGALSVYFFHAALSFNLLALSSSNFAAICLVSITFCSLL